jgi:multimeric flavodoxin WrbA
MPKSLLITYYSKKGHTEKMAKEIVKAVEKEGVNAILKEVDDCIYNDLIEVDGLAIGSPTYYGNMAWPVKRFLDETILSFYTEGHSLKHKVCGCFTSVGAYKDGKKCIETLEFAFGFDLKMNMIPGIIIETKDVENGKIESCYLFGKKLAQEIGNNIEPEK